MLWPPWWALAGHDVTGALWQLPTRQTLPIALPSLAKSQPEKREATGDDERMGRPPLPDDKLVAEIKAVIGCSEARASDGRGVFNRVRVEQLAESIARQIARGSWMTSRMGREWRFSPRTSSKDATRRLLARHARDKWCFFDGSFRLNHKALQSIARNFDR